MASEVPPLPADPPENKVVTQTSTQSTMTSAPANAKVSMMDPAQPMFMPEGSVRAIGFLMVLLTLCWMAACAKPYSDGTRLIDPKDFMMVVMLCVSYFFKQQGGK